MSGARAERIGLMDKMKKSYRGIINEMKKVHWPSKRELVVYTLVVVTSVFVVGIMIWLVDLGISFIMNNLIK